MAAGGFERKAEFDISDKALHQSIYPGTYCTRSNIDEYLFAKVINV